MLISEVQMYTNMIFYSNPKMNKNTIDIFLRATIWSLRGPLLVQAMP